MGNNLAPRWPDGKWQEDGPCQTLIIVGNDVRIISRRTLSKFPRTAGIVFLLRLTVEPMRGLGEVAVHALARGSIERINFLIPLRQR